VPVTFLSTLCLAKILTFFIGFVLTPVSSRQLLLPQVNPVLVVGTTPGNRIVVPLGLFSCAGHAPSATENGGGGKVQR